MSLLDRLMQNLDLNDMDPTGVSAHKRAIDAQEQGDTQADKRLRPSARRSTIYLPPSQQQPLPSMIPIYTEKEDEDSEEEEEEEDEDAVLDETKESVDDDDDESSSSSEDLEVDTEDSASDEEREEEVDEEGEEYDPRYAQTDDDVLRSLHRASDAIPYDGTTQEVQDDDYEPSSDDEEEQARKRLGRKAVVPLTVFDEEENDSSDEDESDSDDSNDTSDEEDEQENDDDDEEEEEEYKSSDKRAYERWQRRWPRRNKEWAERDRIIDEKRARKQQVLIQPERSGLLNLPIDALAIVMAHLPQEDAASFLVTKSRVLHNDTLVQRGFRLNKRLVKASEQWNIGHPGEDKYKYQDEDTLRKRARNAIQMMDYDFADPISKDTIPPHLVQLWISGPINAPFLPGVLPSTLQSIALLSSSRFNQPFAPGSLPPSLTSLSITTTYNQPFQPGSLPASLLKLEIYSRYTQQITENVLPSSLTYLLLLRGYDHPLPMLPSSLKELILPETYNQPIPSGIISTCKISVLSLPTDFNQPLSPNTFPASLVDLVFGSRFNQPLNKGVLPPALESLSLGSEFVQPLVAGVLPPSVHTLNLSQKWDDFIYKGVLPSSLKSITYGVDYDHALVVGALPDGVTAVRFSVARGLFNQAFVPGVFPSSLHHLTLSRFYDQSIEVGVLPEGLKSLEFGQDFNQPLVPGSLPSTLTNLSFAMMGAFNQEIKPGVLSSDSLSLLLLPRHYPHLVFKVGVLPDSLVGQPIYFGDMNHPRILMHSHYTNDLIATNPLRHMQNTGQGQGQSNKEKELFSDDPRGPHPTFIPMSSTSPPMPEVVRLFMMYFPKIQVFYKKETPGDKVYGSRSIDPEDDWYYWIHGGEWQEYMYKHMDEQASTELYDPRGSLFMEPYLTWIQNDPHVVVSVLSNGENGFHGTMFIHLTYIIYILFEMYSRVQKRGKRAERFLRQDMAERYTPKFIESMLLYEYHREYKHTLEINDTVEGDIIHAWLQARG